MRGEADAAEVLGKDLSSLETRSMLVSSQRCGKEVGRGCSHGASRTIPDHPKDPRGHKGALFFATTLSHPGGVAWDDSEALFIDRCGEVGCIGGQM